MEEHNYQKRIWSSLIREATTTVHIRTGQLSKTILVIWIDDSRVPLNGELKEVTVLHEADRRSESVLGLRI